jgi:hypothetical protein
VRLFSIYLTSIICGFCLMALEILGGRLLYPSFGSSIDVWAAVICVFILSLSIGYVIGGRIADRSKDNLPLAWIILVSGCIYVTLPIYALSLSETLGESMGQLRFGVLAAGLCLFLLPSLLLGMVSPVLVKLAFISAERVGRTTGTLYAIGSVGNVLGILVTDYVLLEYVPLNTTLIVMGIILATLGLAHLAIRTNAEGAGTGPVAGTAA